MARKSKGKPKDLFAGLAHPLRRRILRAMLDDEAHVVATPRKLANSFGEHINVVSYHYRILCDCKAVTLVKTERVRGATQHFYRCSLKDDWTRLALAATKD